MYKSIRVVLCLMLALGLAGAVACDSDNGGGGGATPTTGYTQADLAGRWRITFTTSAATAVAILEIDANGNVTECYDKGGTWVLGKGRFTVTADGKIRGDFLRRAGYDPATGTYDEIINCFVAKFRDKTRLKGELLQRIWEYVNGTPPPVLIVGGSWTMHWHKVE